jgi:hypothetical protein
LCGRAVCGEGGWVLRDCPGGVLLQLTVSSVGKEEEIGVRALEFWNVICEACV